MITKSRVLATLPPGHGDRLMALAHEVHFPVGTRLFHEGGRADRFWFVRSGTVALDVRVPGRGPAVVEILRHGELLGWSWLFTPHEWHLGAVATTEVHAYEFDADAVRALCDEDPVLGRAVAVFVAETVARRLKAARVRLLDLYGPHGSGSPS
ncbi:cyclic nucleotide-binding domain-containing protein [Streptomyces sp. NPDC054796]